MGRKGRLRDLVLRSAAAMSVICTAGCSMTEAEKEEFIADGERRMEKSKWMLTVIFPLVMTFCLDLFVLYILEPLFTNFGG